MHRIPAKRIYLLAIIVVGVIALVLYSTYAIFTLESETGNVVSINTPNSINLFVNSYEYKKVTIPKNNYISLDMDVYNNTNNALCYSAWYKTENEVIDKISVYEKNEDNISTSGVIDPVTNRRISLIIINDNNVDVTVKVGLTYEENSEQCSLRVSDNRLLVSSTIDDYKSLSVSLINKLEVTNSEEGYLTYKNNENTIPVKNKIILAKSFTYTNEVFTLVNPTEVEPEKIKENVDDKNYYTCLNANNCQKLYKINNINEETTKEVINDIETEVKHVSITNYDNLIGYLAGSTGLRKVGSNYVYYGDNPHNFIYYNCQNEMDEKTCELWRILGFYYDTKESKYFTRIIKDSAIGLYAYNNDDNNTWGNSTIDLFLNNEYKLQNKNYLMTTTFKQENILEDEITTTEDEITSLVTLMNVSDYLNASACEKRKVSEYDTTCLKKDWLNNNTTNLTMSIKKETPYTDDEENEIVPSNDMVYAVNNVISNVKTNEKLNIRPVVSLKPRTLIIAGDGTLDNPYIIR